MAKLYIIEYTENGGIYLHSKAFTDELVAQYEACKFSDIATDFAVRCVNLPYIGRHVYAVHTEKTYKFGGFVERGCNGGIYSNLKYAKRSKAWRRATSCTTIVSENSTLGENSIDWFDANDTVLHNTTIYAITVMKDSFFPKKVRKHSNLIRSGEIVGKYVAYSSNSGEFTTSVNAAKYGPRTVYLMGYRIVQTNHGYAVFWDGSTTQFIKGLPIDAKFRHILQAIADDNDDYGVTIVEVE
jgi:hypothetical protein